MVLSGWTEEDLGHIQSIVISNDLGYWARSTEGREYGQNLCLDRSGTVTLRRRVCGHLPPAPNPDPIHDIETFQLSPDEANTLMQTIAKAVCTRESLYDRVCDGGMWTAVIRLENGNTKHVSSFLTNRYPLLNQACAALRSALPFKNLIAFDGHPHEKDDTDENEDIGKESEG